MKHINPNPQTPNKLSKRFALVLCLAGGALASFDSAMALPRVDQAVETGTLPLKVFPDHERDGVYWYIPISIDPWSRDSRYQSSLFENDRTLSFVFRGQASVDPKMLEDVAHSIGISTSKLVPIHYEESSNLTCQNFYVDNAQTKWLFPTRIGNYLEVLPISLRTTDPEIKEEISYHLRSGGFGCTVDVKFKAVSTAYKLKVTANMNEVYKRFEMNAHARGFWWEVDISKMLEKLKKDRWITFESYEDPTLGESELQTEIKAAWDKVVGLITDKLFEKTLKLPSGPIVGRGKSWSLRTDYRYSSENARYQATLESRSAVLKDTQLSVRMALQ